MKTLTARRSTATQLLSLGLASMLCSKPIVAHADDIDIFIGASAGKAGNPRVLIVLDNTSNWARKSQKWPDGISQGQSEANAIRKVIADLDSSINVGLMEFVTVGNANDDGGFIRHAIAPVDDANKAALTAKMNTIYSSINSPDEKRNSNTPYGNLMYDVFNYFSGGYSYSPAGVASSIADRNGYTTPFARFKAPISAEETCGKTFMIFITNPNSSGPQSDTAANSALLEKLNGEPVKQLALHRFENVPDPKASDVGVTAACYASPAAAAAELPNFAAKCDTFNEGCEIGAATSPAAPVACPAGTRSYTVVQSVYTPASSTTSPGTPVTGTPVTYTGTTTGYYHLASEVPSTDTGGMSCPASTTTYSGADSTTTTYSCTYTVGAATSTSTTTTTTAPNSNS
jgi:hypothetical protein